MPENPDEIQYAESFHLRCDGEVAATLNEIIGHDNRIVHYTLHFSGSAPAKPWFLTVLYEPLSQAEKDRRAQDHLLHFGKTDR